MTRPPPSIFAYRKQSNSGAKGLGMRPDNWYLVGANWKLSHRLHSDLVLSPRLHRDFVGHVVGYIATCSPSAVVSQTFVY